MEASKERERRLGATEGEDWGRERRDFGTKRGKIGGRKKGKGSRDVFVHQRGRGRWESELERRAGSCLTEGWR